MGRDVRSGREASPEAVGPVAELQRIGLGPRLSGYDACGMQQVDFFKLPRAVQDRVVGGMRGEFPPSPLARLGAKRVVPWLWLALFGAGMLGLAILLGLGFGSLSERGRQGAPFLVGYVAAAFAAMFGAIGALSQLVRAGLVPFPRGTFLYATRILFTEQHPIRTVVLPPDATVDVVPSGLTVKASGVTYLFPCDAMQASAAMGAIAAVAASRAEQPGENDFVDEQDPLHQPRFASPVGESEALVFRLPSWIRFGWAIALGLAVVVGGVAFGVRNTKSDKKMFQLAREQNTVAAYRAYLLHGKAYRGDVEKTLLPRAELHEAVQAANPEAILAFEKAHPDVAIAHEVQMAKKAALLEELGRRERAGNLTAVRVFSQAFPGAGLEAEEKLAIGRLYRKVAEKVAGKSPEAALVLSAALQYAEKHGPEANVVWQGKPSKNLANLEKVLVRVPEYMGDQSKPSKHYDDAALQKRGAAFGEAFAAAVAEVIPVEYLQFKVAAAPNSAVPTLLVTEQLEWSGYTLRSKKPRGVYVGMQFLYDATLSVPQSAKSYRQHFVVGRRITDPMLKEFEKAEPGFEAKLYLRMLDEAHDEVQKKLDAALFE